VHTQQQDILVLVAVKDHIRCRNPPQAALLA
jgi:hypothetical protein